MGRFPRIAEALMGKPLSLPERLAHQYPELTGISLRRGGLMPRIAGWLLGEPTVAAITLRRTVFFGQRTMVEAPILLHELRHVEQFLERRTFPVRYIWESLRRGYHRNRYEVDARMYAAHRLGQALRTPPAEEV